MMASWLCAQPFVQAQIKENIKTPHHYPLWRNPLVISGFSSKRASNTECFHLMMSSWMHVSPSYFSLRFAKDSKAQEIWYWNIVYCWPGDSSHKRPVMWKVFPCHDVCMLCQWTETSLVQMTGLLPILHQALTWANNGLLSHQDP